MYHTQKCIVRSANTHRIGDQRRIYMLTNFIHSRESWQNLQPIFMSDCDRDRLYLYGIGFQTAVCIQNRQWLEAQDVNIASSPHRYTIPRMVFTFAKWRAFVEIWSYHSLAPGEFNFIYLSFLYSPGNTKSTWGLNSDIQHFYKHIFDFRVSMTSFLSPCGPVVAGSSTIAGMEEDNKLGVSVTPKRSCPHLHLYLAQALPPLEVCWSRCSSLPPPSCA